jgi:uncharacterized protein
MNPQAKLSIHFGDVIHHRFSPENLFRYPTFYLRIPMRSKKMDPHLFQKSGIGNNRFSWISFYDKDHGDQNVYGLDWIEHILAQAQLNDVDGEIWLHTFPRVLGFVFNPVSFWFCHQASGELKAIVAEVNNTFGERHTYLLRPSNATSLSWGQELFTEKIFHVSPFFDVIGQYRFRFMQQSSDLENPKYVSRIDYFQNNVHTLMTSISGTEYPLNNATKWKAILRFPFLTMSVVLKIHWQAVKLWFKGAKFYKKPKPPNISIS